MSSVLVIASDPNIESLLGELVRFAGYGPLYDVTTGAGGESIRRVRPDVVLLDTSLPRGVIDSCLAAADEVRCQPVLMSSMDSLVELAEQARALHCPYFPLTGGFKALADILDRAVAEKQMRPLLADSENWAREAYHAA